MDTQHYRQLVQTLLTQHAQTKPAYGDIEVELIFDIERDRYQIVHMGWHHQRRIHHCVMHIDIRDGKIWIFHNTTEHDLAAELLTMGVPREDIVLGLYPPDLRQFTEFAVS